MLCLIFFIGLCAVVGHEISGVVSKVGSNVQDISIGDHVGVGYFVDTCLNCEYCKNDQENNCVKGRIVFPHYLACLINLTGKITRIIF